MLAGLQTEHFEVESHVIPAGHTRGTQRGEQTPNSPFRLAVKHYGLKTKPTGPDGFNLVLAHGFTSSKEAFEPFLDDLMRAKAPIRSCWAIDAAHNGDSYLLNEEIIGDDFDWLDYPRDLLHMMNHFQTAVEPPIVAIGHSWGCGCLAVLASWHPRLFAGVVFLEPAFGPSNTLSWPAPRKFHPGVLALRRTDWWSSRRAAACALRKNRFYHEFDDRVFENVLRFELRDCADGVTLKTPKKIEAYMWMTMDPPMKGTRRRHDMGVPSDATTNFPGARRPEAYYFYNSLRSLHPPMLYVCGSSSPVTDSLARKEHLEAIGRGPEGNGGTQAGAVTLATVRSAHMMPHENPRDTAIQVSKWLNQLSRVLSREREMAVACSPPFVRGVQPEFQERFSKL